MNSVRSALGTLLILPLLGIPTLQAQQDSPSQPQDQRNQQSADKQTGQDGTQTGQRERFEARKPSLDGRQRPQGPQSVTQVLLGMIRNFNEAEIELAQMATQRASHEGVKQFAQTLVQDHQKLNQQTMQQFQSEARSRDGSAAQPDSGQQARQRQSGQEQNRGQNQPDSAQRNGQQQSQQQQSQQQLVPQELVQIGNQAWEASLEKTIDLLSQYDQRDFDKSFLFQQALATSQAIAELEAVESMGPQKLQPLAQTAIRTCQQHLERIDELGQQLQNSRQNPSAQR